MRFLNNTGWTVASTMFLTMLVACGDDSSSNSVSKVYVSEVSSSSNSTGFSSSSVSDESEENEIESAGSEHESEKNSLKDLRDGQVYKTVKIGNQEWMAENLNYNAYGSVCYGEDNVNCGKYGRLYTWGGAMDSSNTKCGYGGGDGCSALMASVNASKKVQGICPSGSHLPSYEEMQTMISFVGGGDVTTDGAATAGTALKAKSGWDKGNGEDAYGFSALPAGRWQNGYDGSFENVGEMTGFWSTNFDEYYGHVLHVMSGAKVEYWQAPKQLGYSVRCIVDQVD